MPTVQLLPVTDDFNVELPVSNLYRNGSLIVFPADGEQLLIRDKISTVGGLQDSYYTVAQNDSLDGLAYIYYKNIVPNASKYWWAIADANNIYDPLDLSDWIGKDILIPNILNLQLQL